MHTHAREDILRIRIYISFSLYKALQALQVLILLTVTPVTPV